MSADCSVCGAPLVEITLSITESDLTMASCSRCDRRSWRGGRTRVSIETVLGEIHDGREKVRRRRSSAGS